MAQHCHGHIAHCLARILAGRGSATVAVSGRRRLIGADLVDGVRRLAAGLSELGVRPGHVVAVVAVNRYTVLEPPLSALHLIIIHFIHQLGPLRLKPSSLTTNK